MRHCSLWDVLDVVNVQENHSNVNRSRERNVFRPITICYFAGWSTETNEGRLQGCYSKTRETENRGFSMRAAEFTALMLHQCAAVVTVNPEIDQTAEPKRSTALSQSKGSAKSKTYSQRE